MSRCKFTEAFAVSVLEHLASGKSVRSWCDAKPGRPSRMAVLRWALSDIGGFRERYKEARRIGAEALADDVIDDARAAVGKDLPGVQAQRLIVDTVKFVLAHRSPDDWGDRPSITGPMLPGAQIQIVLPAKGSMDRGKLIDGTGRVIDAEREGESE